MKILIADDDDVSRLAQEVLLTKRGYEVTSADGGVEAWAALQGEDAPQMAILDWMMPGTGSKDVAASAKIQGSRPSTSSS